jgi:GNAT superfamily N-acetyltransferase
MDIRSAVPADTDAILELIHALAEYERAPEEVKITREQLQNHLFSQDPKVFCEVVEVDGHVVGIAIWFLNFSTWLGKHGIYLEDLFIRPEYRGRGLGKALLVRLAQICVERDYGRFQWWVLDWNEPSIEFYKSLGAVAMDEWTVYRVSGEPLRSLSEKEIPN